jgi:hypothetical protein
MRPVALRRELAMVVDDDVPAGTPGFEMHRVGVMSQPGHARASVESLGRAPSECPRRDAAKIDATSP